MKKILKQFVFVFFLMESQAAALPEIARYGHFTCTSCHVSPGGAGTLTSYGREFSASKISTWSFRKEENPIEGLVPLSDRYLLGGDIRWVSTKVQTGDDTFSKTWRMQTDIEGGVHIGPTWFTYMLGTQPVGPMADSSEASKILTRSFMARADLWDDHIIVRAGLFMPKYGLMLSDHTAYVRRATGLNPDGEQSQAEFIYQTDSIEITAAALFQSSMFEREDKSKSGFNLGISGFLFDRNRINFNILKTDLESGTTTTGVTAMGLSGVVGLLRRLYFMFEIDRIQNVVETDTANTNTTALANYFSLNFEAYKGVIPFAQYEFWDTDTAEPNTSSQQWGSGLNWYPRPHFQIQGRYLRSIANKRQTASNETDFVLHYYF